MRDTYLADIVRTFLNYRTLAERAVAQVRDEDLGVALDSEGNSIAVLMQHLGGNLHSRFTDFLTSDGEKPHRDRDAEFLAVDGRTLLEARWNVGWDAVLRTLDALTPADLDRTVYIRGEAFLVPEALSRAVTHAAYHVGQIVLLARHFAGPAWKTLSIPRGRSREFGTGTFKQQFVPPVDGRA